MESQKPEGKEEAVQLTACLLQMRSFFPSEADVVTPTLRTTTMRYREVKKLVQCHTAIKW